MSPQEAWEALLGSELVKGFAQGFPARHHEIDFWKFRSVSHEGTRSGPKAAPDAVFRFDFGEGGRLWLALEIKSDAPQSSHDADGNGTQLARQWNVTTSDARLEGATVKQAYLALHSSNARSAIEETKQADVENFNSSKWIAAQPIAMTWSEMCSNLTQAALQASAVGRWAKSVAAFLAIRNVKPFSGFRGVNFQSGWRPATYRFGISSFR